MKKLPLLLTLLIFASGCLTLERGDYYGISGLKNSRIYNIEAKKGGGFVYDVKGKASDDIYAHFHLDLLETAQRRGRNYNGRKRYVNLSFVIHNNSKNPIHFNPVSDRIYFIDKLDRKIHFNLGQKSYLSLNTLNPGMRLSVGTDKYKNLKKLIIYVNSDFRLSDIKEVVWELGFDDIWITGVALPGGV